MVAPGGEGGRGGEGEAFEMGWFCVKSEFVGWVGGLQRVAVGVQIGCFGRQNGF